MIELKQSPVRFESEGHRYFIGDKELHGITSTLINRAFPNDYKDIPEAVLRKAAERGSNVHETIELYEDIGAMSDLPELRSYITIMDDNKLEHVASEYLISDEQNYATAIDHVLIDSDGGIVIADVKTTYEKHYEKVALQLSICKRFFEMQNPGLKVSKCALIWLRGEDYEYRELMPWADEVLDMLFDADLHDTKFDITTTYGDLPTRFAQVEEEVARLEVAVKAAQERQKELKQGLYALMEKYNVKSFTGSRVKLTRVLPTESTSFDTNAFKNDHKDLYEQYSKKTTKAGSLRITLK